MSFNVADIFLTVGISPLGLDVSFVYFLFMIIQPCHFMLFCRIDCLFCKNKQDYREILDTNYRQSSHLYRGVRCFCPVNPFPWVTRSQAIVIESMKQ